MTIIDPLEGDPLPGPAEISGVIAMGGPMGVADTDRHPALADECDWLANVVERGKPALGVCLGAQLLARALGARVRSGEEPEIGFAPVEVLDPADPVVGGLAPRTVVLHWHSDVFELPAGAQRLALTTRTENQAFRLGSAWGLMFHPECDAALVDDWLSVPQMVAEAQRALGRDGVGALRSEVLSIEKELTDRSQVGFRAFVEMVEAAQ